MSPGAMPSLASLATLAARSFGSTAEATQALLETVVEQLGLRTSCLTHTAPGTGRNTIVAAYNRPGGSDIAAGAELPLDDTC